MKSQIKYELSRFTQEQRKLVYENLFAIELTEGCSIGCDFCGFEATRGVGNAIPFSVLEQISQEIPEVTDRITNPSMHFRPTNILHLYDATDPLDYEQDGKNYFDAHKLFSSGGFKVGISTAIPTGKEELAVENIEEIGQISISHMNRERLQPYFHRLGIVVFFDLFNHYYTKYGSRNYGDKALVRNMIYPVEETVGKTLEQLRKLDSNLPGQARFYDLRVDGNVLRKRVQRNDMLFLFCGNPGKYPRTGKVVDRDDGQVRNNGRAFDFGYFEREYPDDPLEPFGNTNGVKITPRGVFNVFCVNPSTKNKSGRIIERVSPDDFHAVKLNHPHHLTNFTFIPAFDCVYSRRT